MTLGGAQAGHFGAALRARREVASSLFPLSRIEFVVDERNEEFLAVTHGMSDRSVNLSAAAPRLPAERTLHSRVLQLLPQNREPLIQPGLHRYSGDNPGAPQSPGT